VARISVNGNASVVAGNVAGGLDVVFGGVEVFEVRARELGWRKAAVAAGLAALVLLCAGAWTRATRGTMSADHVRQCFVVTGLTALYLIWAARQVGVVWRFDHKRRTITRRHWLRGMSRNWKSGQVVGAKLLNGKARLGGETVQLGLIDATGKMVAEVGCWDRSQVDLAQVEAVVGEIKKVMWWK
jgi:hypothetical protein